MQVRSDDAQLFYEVRGRGPDIVLLHPFPSNHEFWNGVVERLELRYRLILPDLRGLGQSEVGAGTATMSKLADDLERICVDAGVTKAVFGGCSIGGYVLFEFWRKHRERFHGLVLCSTKAGLDSDEVRTQRLRTADEVMQRGPEFVIEGSLNKLPGESTRRNRPDIVAAAKRTMTRTAKEGIAALQKGMAERQDSTPLLASIGVPTLIIAGEEDVTTPPTEMERIARGIRNSEMKVIDKAGHLAALERPEEVARILRQWLDALS